LKINDGFSSGCLKKSKGSNILIKDLTNRDRFHRFRIKVESKKAGETYGNRQVFGICEKVGFEKKGEARRIGEAP